MRSLVVVSIQRRHDAPPDTDIRLSIRAERMREMLPDIQLTAVHAIPCVCAAPPGIRITVDLPQIAPALSASR